MKKIWIFIIAAVLIIAGLYLAVINKLNHYGSGEYYEGFSVSLTGGTISIEEFNLTDSEIATITNDTFKFIIEVEDSTGIVNTTYSFYKYGYNNGKYPAAIEAVRENEVIFMKENSTYQFNFSIYWVINSTEPTIQNLEFLDADNLITGHFSTNHWDFNITFDESYEDIISINQDSSISELLELPYGLEILMQNQWVVAEVAVGQT